MALLDRCGHCGAIDVMGGLNTVQCLRCGWITRNDGFTCSADERLTDTIHTKHQKMYEANDVPVEG